MKNMLCVFLAALLAVLPAACISRVQAESAGAFQPRLDRNTSCEISVIGSYSNFEALEVEFDRFNEFYPDVELSYTKPDDYNNLLGIVLESSNAPNIFFSYQWMCGNEKYQPVYIHMEDLSDPQLGLDLDCLRPGLLNHDADGHLMMVPVFARNYGMLVNNDLFAKEGLQVPTTWEELLAVCEAFLGKGYASPMMGYSLKSSSCFMNTVAYPLFVATLAKNKEALTLANNLDPAAGENMRPALEAMEHLIQNGCIDLSECDKIEDNYTQVILRFFEGDVPMMICAGDTVSGTKKREGQSEAFTKAPFDYTFAPIPMTDEGGYFIDSPSIQFSVNKGCDNLDMTNEFMRFLVSNEELNQMASVKRLVTPTRDLTFDKVYAPFGQVPADRTISPEVLGIKDRLVTQIRVAAFRVGKGEMTIDEAISMYGSFE